MVTLEAFWHKFYNNTHFDGIETESRPQVAEWKR